MIVPLIALVTARLVAVRFVITPTEVSEEFTTLAASVVPVSVPAAAATVISVVPSKSTLLMLRPVVSLAALATVPLIWLVTDKVVIVAVVAVKLFKVPTEVNDELTIFGLSVVPVVCWHQLVK